MLTPAFELSQDAVFLTVVIKAPFANVSEADVHIDDCEFKFYAKPYYLRLNLPGALVEDGRESAKYDCEKGVFTIKVAKQNKGEMFEGLDLLTKLLTPVKSVHTKPTIEVLNEKNQENNGQESSEEEEEEFDWQIEQVPYSESELCTEGPKYGFANQTSGVLKRLQSELPEIIDLQDADNILWSERCHLREADEDSHFDEDHYMADFCESNIIQGLLQFTPEWENEARLVRKGKAGKDIVPFTDEESETLRNLPRKEYVVDDPTQQLALLSLVDIMFAYAYNHRTTEGENTVESGWTMCKLSSTLSWLQVHQNLKESVRSGFRRCLCYPLYRHWDLTCAVFDDVKNIFTAGQKRILKCLLDIHSLLKDSDSRYILNDLYITDYCVWLQTIRQKHLESLAQSLCELSITKSEVGFDLQVIEEVCVLAMEEDCEGVAESIAHLNIDCCKPNTEVQNECPKDNGETIVECQKCEPHTQDKENADEICEAIAALNVDSSLVSANGKCSKDSCETKYSEDCQNVTCKTEIQMERNQEVTKDVASLNIHCTCGRSQQIRKSSNTETHSGSCDLCGHDSSKGVSSGCENKRENSSDTSSELKLASSTDSDNDESTEFESETESDCSTDSDSDTENSSDTDTSSMIKDTETVTLKQSKDCVYSVEDTHSTDTKSLNF